MSDTRNSNIYSIIIVLLLLLSALLGWFFWSKSKAMIEQAKRNEITLDSLVTVKLGVEKSLDSLEMSYTSLRTENETLQGKISSTAALVAQKQSIINQIKASSANDARDMEALRGQIAELQRVKTEYETIVNVMRSENDQLKNENLALKGENSTLKGEKQELAIQLGDLSDKLAEQIRKTQSAVFKATSFRVEIEKRNDRLTTRARKAREIGVSFDLADVPDAYFGPQKLYLVITDENGKPIESMNATKATVMAPAGNVEIMAQQVKPVTLEKTQRHAFLYKLEEKLASGNYVVAIYCDKGLLGASSFKLGR
jgi:septal ring factor EnvC (AmiA/AmiB activator)